MPHSIRHRRRPSEPGQVPGSVALSSDQPDVRAHVIAYNSESVRELDVQSIDEVATVRGEFDVVWIDVIGHGDAELLRSVRSALGLHELAVEDVVNVGQRCANGSATTVDASGREEPTTSSTRCWTRLSMGISRFLPASGIGSKRSRSVY
jgi:hypothetical protein